MRPVFHLITTISRGGAENQLLVLAKEQVILGLEVHVIFLKDQPELLSEFERVGAKVHSGLSKMPVFIQPFWLGRLVSGQNGVVHAHLPRAELIALMTIGNFKLIVTRHNAEPFFPGAPKWISNLLSRAVSVRAFKVIAISEAVKDFLISRGELVNNSKIHVIRYGYRPRLQRLEHPKEQSGEITSIGTISRLSPQKDLSTMLRSFAAYHLEDPKSQLSIMGAGPLKSQLKLQSEELGISEVVYFLGRSAEVYEFLAGLDVFLLTSKYEGFGLVLLEAMDAKVPILAARNSAIPEVLGVDFPGLCETGNVEDFSNKILLLQDQNFRRQILTIQEERLSMFEASKMCERVNWIY